MFEAQQTAFLNPLCTAEDLEARVEYWHTHETDNSLREFLGISQKEYQLWLAKGDDALLEELRKGNIRGNSLTRRRTADNIMGYAPGGGPTK